MMLVITSVRFILYIHLVSLAESFIHYVDLVLELVEGGDLLDYILSRGGISKSSLSAFLVSVLTTQHIE